MYTFKIRKPNLDDKEICYVSTVIVTANVFHSRNELINRIEGVHKSQTLLWTKMLYDHQPVLMCTTQGLHK